MTPDDAYALLAELLAPDGIRRAGVRLYDLARAWKALDEALSGSGNLPHQWARLNALAAARRAGKPNTAQWHALVNKGYAPGPDGEDSAGRAWWHPATIDAYLDGSWQPVPHQRDPDTVPPSSGVGASREAWARFAERRGVTVTSSMRRDAIQDACRGLGIIN